MTEITFEPWPKTPRLFKDSMVITEKIDGTNSAVGVVLDDEESASRLPSLQGAIARVPYGDATALVYAQSRNRIIQPVSLSGQKGSDNYAFAEWVYNSATELARVLGPGLHYGEWWGAGIGRGYGRTDRSFSLFNTSRWKHLNDPEARAALSPPKELDVVPVLAVNTLDTAQVRQVMYGLQITGSRAAPGFMNPEGVCVFLPSAQQVYKVTFDDRPKTEVARDEYEVAA